MRPPPVFAKRLLSTYSKKYSLKLNVKGEMLSGYFSVRLALESDQRTFHKIFFNPNSTRVAEDIIDIAQSKDIICEETSWKTLDQLSRYSSHKGVCADVSPIVPQAGDHLANETASQNYQLWLLMASIGDPQNMGAIIRSAYFLGVDKIFTCSPHDSSQASSALTPSVSRASAGTLEIFVPKVVYRPEVFLETLRDQGWDVIGSHGPNSNSQEVRNVDVNRVLIVGNEGDGLPTSISKYCNDFMTIQPHRQLHDCVDSLNVSVATALLLQQLRSTRSPSP